MYQSVSFPNRHKTIINLLIFRMLLCIKDDTFPLYQIQQPYQS